ncbi:MAG TPA: phage portal protein, partial [Gemmatimonadales bacterium]|nr:phage portal protein [Gemmatimonadales bacterium]
SGKEPIILQPNQVAHFAARPDPETRFTGMSWITPAIREVMGDKAATEHKLKFFENGATPNLAVKLDVQDLDVFKEWIKEFKTDHEGTDNAYKTMFLAAGADVTAIGTDLQQLEFKITQGAGETRIAADAGVPPVVAGFSEGLAAATYSNYAQARRRFADQTIRPLWRNVCGSLQMVVHTPPDAQLWYDDKDVSALQEDQKDAAEIMQGRSTAIKTFVDAGYTPESAVKAVAADDLSLLVHTGLVSVQLQPPGSKPPSGGAGNENPTDGGSNEPNGPNAAP